MGLSLTEDTGLLNGSIHYTLPMTILLKPLWLSQIYAFFCVFMLCYYKVGGWKEFKILESPRLSKLFGLLPEKMTKIKFLVTWPLIHKASPEFCSRPHFKFLLFLKQGQIRLDISCEMSAGLTFHMKRQDLFIKYHKICRLLVVIRGLKKD